MSQKTTNKHKFDGERLLAHADRCREQFFTQIEQINHALQNVDDTIADDGRSSISPLILQLRLDSQHTIDALLKLNSSYCQVIGIDNRNNSAQNFERLKHALGKEGISTAVKYLLKLITNIENSLRLQNQQLAATRKIANRLRANYSLPIITEQSDNKERKLPEQANEFRYDMPYNKIDSMALLFNQALRTQAYFQFSIEQLTEAYEHYAGVTDEEEVAFDEIAALEGPITRFFMAAQHGLAMLETMFFRAEQDLGARYETANELELQHDLEKKLTQRIGSLQLYQQQTLHLTEQTQHLLQQSPHAPSYEFFHPQVQPTDAPVEDLDYQAHLARTMRFYRP